MVSPVPEPEARGPRPEKFTPLFPFDPGRRYQVEYFAAARASGDVSPVIRQTIGLPARPPSAPASVTRVYPSGDVIPENQLRMYIHFSAPMGRRGGVEHVRLLDQNGRQVKDPFLPLEAEFWNGDRTRYTLFFDPGRQKRGILPNREMGPSLVAGRDYTFVINRQWLDGHGSPLRETFTRRFRIGPPDQAALDPALWRLSPPAAGTRDALMVAFPAPLDHGLLLRALGVRHNDRAVAGDITIDREETRWSMTPAEAWQAGTYELVALSILEDRAGNRIGRAFEVQAFERTNRPAEPESASIPFAVK